MIASLLNVLSELVGAAVAPERCAACDVRIAWRTVFCRACAASVERAAWRRGARRTIAPFVYGGAVARAIARFKYEARPDLARPLGDLLRGALAPLEGAAPVELVVPVPLHPTRRVERGFNQAALLARPVARQLRAHFAPRALERVWDTPRQATLDRVARASNVAGAFRARTPRLVRNRRVLLVDDVETTGATLAGCAAALLEAGAAEVATAVLARALEL
jgi:ComF family protein